MVIVRIIGSKSIVKELKIGRATVKQLLEKLGLLTSEYVVLKNNVVVAEEEVVEDSDELVIYPVKSGG